MKEAFPWDIFAVCLPQRKGIGEAGLTHPVPVCFLWEMKKLFALVGALLSFAFSMPSASAQLRCLEKEEGIEVRNGEALVLRYRKTPSADAAKNDPLYGRTGYIHPLCTPSGKVVTGDYEPDHPHQHGLFFAWTKTTFDGRTPEFWNQKQGSGRISYVRTLAIHSGGEICGFDVMHRYEDLTAAGGAEAVLEEIWEVRAALVEGRYQIDLHLVQRCAGNKPLTIERYHYGGMAIRGPSSWLGEEPDRIVTSEGNNRIAGNHSRPAWVKMSGEIEGSRCGVVAIPGKDNFRAPQWVRLHPSKPYFVFSPMVEAPFLIHPGTPYDSRFRFLVYDGEVGSEVIQSFAEGKRETKP